MRPGNLRLTSEKIEANVVNCNTFINYAGTRTVSEKAFEDLNSSLPPCSAASREDLGFTYSGIKRC